MSSTHLDTTTVAKGGTNLTTYAAGDILYASDATTLTKLPKGTADQILAMNSGATAPEWITNSGGSGGAGAAATFERTYTGDIATGRLIPIIIPNELNGKDIKEVRANVLSLPTGQSIKVDVRKNGTATTDSIFDSDAELQIITTEVATNGVYQSGCALVATVGTPSTIIDSVRDTLASDDVLWIYITQVGSTLSGADLVVQISVA